MYEPPIHLYEAPMKAIIEHRENAIYAKIQDAIDVQVDKEELIRALKYDRDQYNKGYADGIADAREEIVHCRECKIQSVCKMAQWLGEDGYCSVGER